MHDGRIANSLAWLEHRVQEECTEEEQDPVHEEPGCSERDLIRKTWGTTERL